MKLVYRADFLEAINDQAIYLATEEADAEIAGRFIDAVKQSTEQIGTMPFLGFAREFTNSKLKSVRVWRVSRFEKYLIFYVPKDEQIEFLYLIHSARDYTRLFDEENPN